MKRHDRISFLVMTLLLACVGFASTVACEEPKKQGGWLIEEDEKDGSEVHTMELTLHPRAEPRPALKYRLFPDDFDMLDENAAIYYLKAMGFFEADPARDRLREIYKEACERSDRGGEEDNEVTPFSWQNMRPEDLPLEEVREFLRLTRHQPRLLREAARRRSFDMDRNLREFENPLGYPLSDIQSMRELARMQTLRCKVAIAERHIDDAVAILGQQVAMARHLSQDEFIVSSLVGAAIARLAWDDMLYLVQHPDTPNLYWALASIPRPLIDLRRSLSVERHLLYSQFKMLQEVDETPRPAGYWRDFLDRQSCQLHGYQHEFGFPWHTNDPVEARAMWVGFIALAYPGAKRYLIDDLGMSAEQVEAYPTAQVVFLSMVRFYDEARDEMFKGSHLPYWQARSMIDDISRRDSDLWKKANRVGFSAMPAQVLMPAVTATLRVSARVEQHLAMVQTVEAIRMHGATHDGKLPKTLEELALPAPVEPYTGKPFDYRHQGDHAILTGHKMPGMTKRLILRFAKTPK